MSRLELCFVCDEPTGRAGRYDDSLFFELKYSIFSKPIGDEIGPLCTDCLDALRQLGLINEY